MMQLREVHEKGRKELLEFFKDVLPLIIVDHNLYETENSALFINSLIFVLMCSSIDKSTL